MRKRKSYASLSLFAFQDIVTATTGVFLFITIILALALINSVPKSLGLTLDANDLTKQLSQLEQEKLTLSRRHGRGTSDK